jgi:hypothetical protein
VRAARIAGVALVAALTAMLAACDSNGPSIIGPTPTPAVVGPNPPGPGPVIGSDGSRVLTDNRGDLHAADFELASGVTTLIVHSGDIGAALFRITTPAGAGVIPAALVSAGHVVLQLSSANNGGPAIVDVALSSAVSWTVHLDGGATSATVDMKAGGLAALDFGAGVARIDTTVAKPGGTLPVRMSGGASEFTVHAPTGVPARVTMTGGGSSATIDGQTHTGIAGGTAFTPEGWDTANPRIDVDNTAGVSSFTLDRY